MHSHLTNTKPTTRALATTSMTLLTLVTLVACLSASQSNTQQRDTRAARITATIFGPHACLVVFASIHDNKPLPNPTTTKPGTLAATTQSLPYETPLFAPLRAIPPPIC